MTKRKLASLNLTTGAPIAGFTANGNGQVNAIAASDTTVYAGGRFTAFSGVARVGLVAVNGTTGAVDLGFDNQLSGGIGVNGATTVQQLKLTHDNAKLMVVHTARKIAGQDRYGVGLIDTATKQLLPWRTASGRRTCPSSVASSASTRRHLPRRLLLRGRPAARAATARRSTTPRSRSRSTAATTSSRCGSPAPSTASTRSRSPRRAVYLGGHFGWNESPTAPARGRASTTWATAPARACPATASVTQVVRRDHIGALDPATGKALEWNPGSNSFEGNKAMEATAAACSSAATAGVQGGVRTGRVAFYDFNTVPAPSTTDTTITHADRGPRRSRPASSS